jgi:hypothetical protein
VFPWFSVFQERRDGAKEGDNSPREYTGQMRRQHNILEQR